MNEESKQITRRAGIVSVGTLASRVLGLVRESVIAAYFPKEVIDAYQVAFMIPNSFRRLTAEGSFSISVTSVFSKIRARGDEAETRAFLRAVLGFALLFLALLTAAGMVFSKEITWLAGAGFVQHADKFALAVDLTRSMFPYVFLVSLVALAMGVLNAAGRFFAPSFAPVLLNVASIACAVGLVGVLPLYGIAPVYSLVIGVLVGGILQLVVQIPSLRAERLLCTPTFDLRNSGLKDVLRMTGPMVFGAAAYQVGLFISSSLASTLGHGAVTYIQFSSRFLELPLAVLVMAISTASLPSLAGLRGQGRIEDMKTTYIHSLRLALFVATPAMVGLIALSEPIMTVMYERGMFTHEDTLATARALTWQAVGICSIALLRQTVPVFYAMEQTRAPVLMGVVYILAYVAVALPLMPPLGHVGLCIALSAAATVQALGLVLLLRRRIGKLGMKATLFSWLRTLLCCGPLFAAAHFVSAQGDWEQGGNSGRNLAVLGAAVVSGGAAFAVAAMLLKVPEMQEFIATLARRRRSK
ncbi:MAG: murein biosynthesis integral membrane protein MurJ [Myxococcota bacterium]|nr:murein biosynthesis integral membrane protein MurJ [Myxococcota bacterium]